MNKKMVFIAVLSSLILISGCSFKNTAPNPDTVKSNVISDSALTTSTTDVNNITNTTDTASTTNTTNITKETEINQNLDQQYKFIKDYNITVTVGGIVGLSKISYLVGDIVTGRVVSDGIEVRIAPHSARNEGELNSASYQELITIPLEYLQLGDPINSNHGIIFLKLDEECSEDLGICAPGLKCSYSCGVPGCANSCLPEDEPARP